MSDVVYHYFHGDRGETKARVLTDEEEDILDQYQSEKLKMQTVTASDEDIRHAVCNVWNDMGYKNPKVSVYPSPKAAKEASKKSGKKYVDYFTFWLGQYIAFYDFCREQLNVQLDEKSYNLLNDWERCCSYIIFTEDEAHVSAKPIEIHLEDEERISNENGMAIKYDDGFGVYVINNVSVDEQIVMRPDTQTIEQITGEENEERKRIRINRYGVDRFLTEIGAKCIDGPHRNDIEGTKEALFATEVDLSYLVCVCPSTGKVFYLETDPKHKTIKEAQEFLSLGASKRIISAS